MFFDLTTPLIKLFLAESRNIFNNLHKTPCAPTVNATVNIFAIP